MIDDGNRDIQLQSLVIGGVLITPHGEGASPRISFSPSAEVSRGIKTDVSANKNNVAATMVCAMWEEEKAFGELLALYRAKRFGGVNAPLLGGRAVNAATGRVIVWRKATFTQLPDFVLGENREIVNWTLELTDAQYVDL